MKNEELVVEHIPLARKLARIRQRMTLPMHVEITDLETEALVALVQAGGRFEAGGASFKNWVDIRISGRLIEYLQLSDMHWKMREELQDVHTVPFGEEESFDFLRRAVATLPQRWRRVLRLHYRDGLRLKEIAELFGCGEGRIMQIQRLAFHRLREYLGQRGVDKVADVL